MKFLFPVGHTVLRCAILLVALMSVNAWAALTAEQAGRLFAKACGSDQEALHALIVEGDKGNPYAQYRLGLLYRVGIGAVSRDDAQAAQWWRKAAQQGNAEAQNQLGFLYVNGEGVSRDYAQAAQWWNKAAQQGNAEAQQHLGALYANGQGVPQDLAQAVQWWRKAAQQGDSDAQINLGQLYVNGQGVPRSKVVAYALWSLSDATVASSPLSTGSSEYHSRLANVMTKQEIEAGQVLSREMSRAGNLLNALDKYLAETKPQSP